jgi:hypothetical protein
LTALQADFFRWSQHAFEAIVVFARSGTLILPPERRVSTGVTDSADTDAKDFE